VHLCLALQRLFWCHVLQFWKNLIYDVCLNRILAYVSSIMLCTTESFPIKIYPVIYVYKSGLERFHISSS
jgi:hypothetical protein